MGFEYGSQAIEIRNPFRVEGLVYFLRGVVVAALGLILLLSVREQVSAGQSTLGAFQFGGGLLLVATGIHALARGLFKLFRFYVGRGVPANLARETSSAAPIAPGSESSFRHQGIYEPPVKLSEMLLGRKNLTFVEPRGWLARLVHSLFFPLIFLPHPMRWITVKLFMALWYGGVLLALLGLALFTGNTGLTEITSTPVAGYLSAAALAAMLLAWLRYQPRRGPWRNDLRDPKTGSGTAFRDKPVAHFFRFVLWVALPVLAAYGLLWLHREQPLDPVPVSPYPWITAAMLSMAAAFGYAFILACRRAPRGTVPTDVTEYRAHWQESVHPMDIFRAVDMTLANHRYKEIPHRVYVHREPNLQREGGGAKGDFDGETLQEIQPEPLERQHRDPLIMTGVVVGQLLLIGSSIWLFIALAAGSADWTPERITATVLGPVLLWMLGRTIAFTANVYLGEIQFQSHLIAFRASGTYSESRLATGMSIYDSTRSENTFVRSSLTPWLIVSRIHSSIIAVSGAMNLEQPRYVLGMERSDALCDELVRDMQSYLRERQVMAGVESASDLEAASTIHQMNERTRVQQAPLLDHPPISQEVRQERLEAIHPNADD